MARIRSIKPEFWDDRKLARTLCRDARMLYMGLWNQADEHARCNADPTWVKGRVFPYDDDLTDKRVGELLDDLARAGRIVLYEVDGDPYMLLPKLPHHQRLEPKVDSRLPAPPDPLPDPPAPVDSGFDANQCVPDAGPPEPDADQPRSDADKSASRADQSASDADESALLYVAGSMEHGAGSREAARGRVKRARPAVVPPSTPALDGPEQAALASLPLDADNLGATASTPADAGPPPAKRRRLRRIPDDLDLSGPRAEYATNHGMSPLDAEHEFAKFRAWHTSKGSSHENWDQTWLTWVLRWEGDQRKRTASGGSIGHGGNTYAEPPPEWITQARRVVAAFEDGAGMPGPEVRAGAVKAAREMCAEARQHRWRIPEPLLAVARDGAA